MTLLNGFIARARRVVLILALLFLPAGAILAESGGIEVKSLVVNRVNIYAAPEAAGNPVYRLVNRFHRTTRQNTILRELNVSPGDVLHPDEVAELERNLRRLNIFASVSVRLVDDGTLEVSTRDRFSIIAGANGSFLGGVGEVGFTIGERNLLGSGDSASLSLRRNTADEIRGVFSYRDLHWLKAQQTALYRVGATEEGEFLQLQFSRPVKYRTDRSQWTAQVESVGQDIDYYEGGLSVVQVPEQRTVFGATYRWRSPGPTVSTRGIHLRFGNYDYDDVRGSQADSIEQPQDNSQILLSALLSREKTTQHRKVTSLDTLRFVQDLQFGVVRELRFGARVKRESSGRSTVRPVVSGSFVASTELKQNTFGKLAASFSTEVIEDKPSTNTSVGLKLYTRFSQRSTLAMRLDYRYADQDRILPTQYTLGESNGLRGYANSLLSGNRMLRLNVEQRYDLQRKLGFLDVGLVSFFDTGWMAPETDRTRRSGGVGVRLGSTALLGRAVIRMDVAFPFDADEVSPVYSAAVGQMFTF